jgi:hypothetical protein
MLNPSTADASRDDRTVRRCMDFAVRWGFAAIEVVNLFALRSPHPAALMEVVDPVGPGNATAMRRVLGRADAVIAAWGGVPPALSLQADITRRRLPRGALCLGVTRGGEPRHPLYVARVTPPRLLASAGGALTVGSVRRTMAA